MTRSPREKLRAMLGRALHDYVVVEVRREVADVRRDLEQSREELRAGLHGLHVAMQEWERRQRRDIYTMVDIEAARSSLEFFRTALGDATAHAHKMDTLISAVKVAPEDGLFLEFGVATGGTLRAIAELAPAGSVYGFDSFEGLPEHWRAGFPVGTFAVDALPDVPGAELVVGWFDRTLPDFLGEHPESIAFLHLDADLYSSTKTVLDAVESRLRLGTVIVFDEYYNFPGWEEHEHRAWTEFVERTGIGFEYLGFSATDEQVSVRLTSVPQA